MLQRTGGPVRTRIPTSGPTGIPSRSKLPLLSTASSAPILLSAFTLPPPPLHQTTTLVTPNHPTGRGQVCRGAPPTEADIGRLMRVDDDRVGVLRYLGAVRFAGGVWCGLELTGDHSAGKNDGQVNGVRYFKCPKQRGLMVPLSKATLIQQDDSDDSMVSSSGPHSLLITNMADETKILNSIVQDTTRTVAYVCDKTYTADNLDKSLDSLKASYCAEDVHNETLCNNQINTSKSHGFSETSVVIEHTPPPQFLPLTFQSTPVAYRSTQPPPPQAPTGCSNTTTTLTHFLPAGGSVDDPTNKRNSLEFEESLGILTPSQMDATTFSGSGLMSFGCCRSPTTTSAECMVWQDKTHTSCTDHQTTATSTSTDLSPSLGIIDENGLAAAFNLRSFATSQGDPLSLSLDVQQLLRNSQQQQHLQQHGNLSNLNHQTLVLLRADQTPSPEELPLDPTPVMLCAAGVGDGEDEEGDVLMTVGSEAKSVGVGQGGGVERGKGSFVTSIISITSLDTGYQGDGEMSRPGSRGADNSSSPMTRRPQPRRNVCDPMTDSDFYTESDADCHESDPQNQHSLQHHTHHHHHQYRPSGDRHAQVIDGTLYAADAHSSANHSTTTAATTSTTTTSSSSSILHPSGTAGGAPNAYPAGHSEPMDSSGVFTDLEGVSDACGAPRGLNRTIVAASPSDSSTQTITDDSQRQVPGGGRGVLSGASSVVKSSSVKTLVSSGDKSGSERSSVSTKAGHRLISTAQKEESSSKYSKVGCSSAKKRAVESKMYKDVTNTNTRRFNTSTSPQEEVQQPVGSAVGAIHHQKKLGRWDAVLDKIGKGSRSAEVRSLKEVRSRVYDTMLMAPGRVGEKQSGVVVVMQKGHQELERGRLAGGAAKGVVGMKPKRLVRTRASPSVNAAAKHSNVESSINSSLSDLSGASPAKKHGSLKPQRIGTAKLSPRSLTGSSSTASGGGNDLATPTPPASHRTPKLPPTSAANNNNLLQQQQGNRDNIVNVNNNNSKEASPNNHSPKTSARGKREKNSVSVRQSTKHHHNDSPTNVNGNNNNNSIATVTTNHCSSPPQTRRVVAVAATPVGTPVAAVPSVNSHRRHLTTTTTAKTTIAPRRSDDAHAVSRCRDDAVKAAEALAVLVQHLVFEVDAFQAPVLKQQVAVTRCDIEAARATCNQLRETLREQSTKFSVAIENERAKSKAELIQLKKSHADDLEKVTKMLKVEMQKLQKIHEEQLDILREENDAIRDQLDERNLEIHVLNQKQHNDVSTERADKTTDTEQAFTANVAESSICLENYSQFDSSSQEVQSLRIVLDLKQTENGDLRKALAEAIRKCDRLPSIEEKLSTRTARCEDLDLQLKLQREKEQQLHAEIKKLKDSFKEETNQKSRLSQYNEELQWKLQQSKEVLTKVMEQTTVGDEQQQHLSRSTGLNSSFSEKNYHSNYTGISSSSPTSPKVKGVVTKSDSVSYVLDMEESVDVLASRIVRRSFRTTNSSNSPLRVNGGNSDSQQGQGGQLSFTPSPKQRSPSSNGSGRRASSGNGSGRGEVAESGKNYLRSKSMTVQRTSDNSCIDPVPNNAAAVTEDEEDDDDDDMGVFWQFNPSSNISDGQKRRLLPPSQSSTPCSHFERSSLCSTSLESKDEPYREESDDSDEDQIQLPALPRQGAVLPPPRHLATDVCLHSEDDDNSCSSSTSSADRL